MYLILSIIVGLIAFKILLWRNNMTYGDFFEEFAEKATKGLEQQKQRDLDNTIRDIQQILREDDLKAEYEFQRYTQRRHEYMKTDAWQTIRALILALGDYKCDMCGTQSNLDIHHISYKEEPGEEDIIDDLIPLCRECHEKVHQTFGYPDRNNYRTKRFYK